MRSDADTLDWDLSISVECLRAALKYVQLMDYYTFLMTLVPRSSTSSSFITPTDAPRTSRNDPLWKEFITRIVDTLVLHARPLIESGALCKKLTRCTKFKPIENKEAIKFVLDEFSLLTGERDTRINGKGKWKAELSRKRISQACRDLNDDQKKELKAKLEKWGTTVKAWSRAFGDEEMTAVNGLFDN